MKLIESIVIICACTIAILLLCSFTYYLIRERYKNKLIDSILNVIAVQNIVESEFTESMNVALRDRYSLPRVEHWTQLETIELEKIIERYSLRSTHY